MLQHFNPFTPNQWNLCIDLNNTASVIIDDDDDFNSNSENSFINYLIISYSIL